MQKQRDLQLNEMARPIPEMQAEDAQWQAGQEVANDAEAETDPGILSRRIYYETYCGKDGDKCTYVVHTPKADLLQARGSQHKRRNTEGIGIDAQK